MTSLPSSLTRAAAVIVVPIPRRSGLSRLCSNTTRLASDTASERPTPVGFAPNARVRVSTARSWLTERTRPVSVADPERRRVISPTDLEHGAADLQEIPLLQLGPLVDPHGVHPRAVGRPEVLHPRVAVEPEQACMQIGGVRVVVDRDPASRCTANGHLLAHVVDAAALVVGSDDMELEGPTALAVHH